MSFRFCERIVTNWATASGVWPGGCSRGAGPRRIRANDFCMSGNVIDRSGFRPNVGIIVCNERGEVFWGKRVGHRSWQFPQGGIDARERPLEAMYRELHEETGLRPEHVSVMAWTRGWLRYRLPRNMVRRHCEPVCIGQKQKWFLLRLRTDESAFDLNASAKPEFDGWEWRPFWSILPEVIYFKRTVYFQALHALAPFLRDVPSECPVELIPEQIERRLERVRQAGDRVGNTDAR